MKKKIYKISKLNQMWYAEDSNEVPILRETRFYPFAETIISAKQQRTQRKIYIAKLNQTWQNCPVRTEYRFLEISSK